MKPRMNPTHRKCHVPCVGRWLMKYASLVFAAMLLLILATAEAQSEDIRAAGSGCLYAGNVSKYVYYPSAKRTYCQAVEKVTIKNQTYSCEDGNHSQVICNPLYSGLNGDKPHCVSRSARSFIQCPRDTKKAQALIKEKGWQKEFGAHLKGVNEKVCGSSDEKKKLYGFACAESSRFERAIASTASKNAEKKPEPKPEAKPEVKQEKKPEVKPEPKPEPKPEKKVEKPAETAKEEAGGKPEKAFPKKKVEPTVDPAKDKAKEKKSKLEAECKEGCEKPKTPVALTKPADESKKEIEKTLKVACAPLPGEPAPGTTKEVLNLSLGAMTMQGKMPEIMANAQRAIDESRTATKGCPQPNCQRKNEPDVALNVTPVELGSSPKCPSVHKAVGFTSAAVKGVDPDTKVDGPALMRNFKASSKAACQEQVKTWTESTLKHESALGKYLNQNLCPDECSYSSEIRLDDKSKTSACDVDVRFTVRCGPPRANMIFNTTYRAKVTIKNNWSCSAK
jgi:hypothetical protein